MANEPATVLDTVAPGLEPWLIGLVLLYLVPQAVLRPILALYVLVFFRTEVRSLLTRAVSISFLGLRLVTWPQEDGQLNPAQRRAHPGRVPHSGEARRKPPALLDPPPGREPRQGG